MALADWRAEVVPHLGLVDGDAADQLHAAHRGAPGGGEGGRDDEVCAAGRAQGSRELRGDVAPEGRVELLVDDAGVAGGLRGLDYPFGGEAGRPRPGVGVEGDGVEAGGWYLLPVEDHGGPVAGAD